MTVIVAREFEPGRFQLAAKFRLSKTGRGAIAAKYRGTIESHIGRTAAKYFAAEPAAATIDYEINGRKYRASAY